MAWVGRDLAARLFQREDGDPGVARTGLGDGQAVEVRSGLDGDLLEPDVRAEVEQVEDFQQRLHFRLGFDHHRGGAAAPQLFHHGPAHASVGANHVVPAETANASGYLVHPQPLP